MTTLLEIYFNENITFQDELSGSHHGQTDMILKAINSDRKIVGYLEYSVFDKKPNIQWIRSFQPGIGTKLVQRLAQEYPYEEIEWGMVTDEGSKLKAKMDAQFGVEEKEKPKVNLDDIIGTKGKLISSEPGSTMGYQNLYMEFDSEKDKQEFVERAIQAGGEDFDEQFWEEGPRWYVGVDIPQD